MFKIELDYGELIQRLIVELCDDYKNRLLMIPHNNAPVGNIESDVDATESIIKKLPVRLEKSIFSFEPKYTPSELKGIISNCDFFIGSRMHACIAALSSGIPTVGIGYSKKFLGVFESVGAGELVIDARKGNIDNCLKKILQIYNDKIHWEEQIRHNIIGIKRKILDNFNEFNNY